MTTEFRIHYQCPACDKMLSIKREYAGKWGKCKYCDSAIKVPALDASQQTEPPPVPLQPIENDSMPLKKEYGTGARNYELKKCRDCGSQIPIQAAFCPACGSQIQKGKQRHSGLLGCGFVILILIMIPVIEQDCNRSSLEVDRTETTDATRESIHMQVLQNAAKPQSQPDNFYMRIAIYNDAQSKDFGRCRIWIEGYGDFWPARDSGWEFGGAIIEKAGPFDTSEVQTLYFYADYRYEDYVIKVPFKFSNEMNPNGSDRDTLLINVGDTAISFLGTAVKNATGKSEIVFN